MIRRVRSSSSGQTELNLCFSSKTNIIYCYTSTCHLAATAALEFAERGYSVMEMDGGFAGWKQYGLPIEKTPAK
jgi:rhodanese-related sulfurtransferase